jgi:demethylmenaquinone methyltransferase/2-methoxy-6-polyprenyl-1,4-benzoquinol methylase
MNIVLHKYIKKKFVTKLFNDIAKTYDLLNHLFSFGVDYYWRNRLINKANLKVDAYVLDAATGTGEVAFNLASKCNRVVGLDIAENMIKIAKAKQYKKRIENINFIVGDAERLPFKDNSFDVITIAYGYRNMSDQSNVLKEFHRVLKDRGKLLILEFSIPKSRFIKSLYRFYSVKIMPKIASFFTEKYAYEYLPASIEIFAKRSEVKAQLANNQFTNIKIIDMTFGISSIFISQKISQDSYN